MPIRDFLPDLWKSRTPREREDTDPFTSLQREMNRLFDDFFGDWRLSPREAGSDYSLAPYSSRFSPCVDIGESDKEYRIECELPGMDEKDVDISLNQNVLTVQGEKKHETEEEKGNVYRTERSYGQFHRDFPLPDDVDEENIEAKFKNGILTITLPKTKKALKNAKHIEITSG